MRSFTLGTKSSFQTENLRPWYRWNLGYLVVMQFRKGVVSYLGLLSEVD